VSSAHLALVVERPFGVGDARGVIDFDPESSPEPAAGGASGRPFGLRAAGLEHSSGPLLKSDALPHIVESGFRARGAAVSGSAV